MVEVENMVMHVERIPDCRENKQAENVKYKKPFPFILYMKFFFHVPNLIK